MNIKKWEEDREKLEESIKQARISVYRYEGALGYVLGNIKKLKEVEDDKHRTDN